MILGDQTVQGLSKVVVVGSDLNKRLSGYERVGPKLHLVCLASLPKVAIDPTGQKILVATQTGVTYFELSVIPLAVGTVSPSAGSAWTSVQIRGSGFVSGTAVQIGGQNSTCTETDGETLSCTIPNLPAGSAAMSLSNPDG